MHIIQAESGVDVLIPGDPERKHMAECDRQGGIPYHQNVIEKLVRHLLTCHVKPTNYRPPPVAVRRQQSTDELHNVLTWLLLVWKYNCSQWCDI